MSRERDAEVPGSDAQTRRRLLTLGGAGAAAAAAGLLGAERADAGHGGDNVMHLGEYNDVPAGSLGPGEHTIIDGESSAPALKVINPGSGPGVEGVAVGGGGGVTGHVFEPAFGPGVSGVSSASGDPGDFGQGSQTGVYGESGSGAGVQGHSDTGVGGTFSSNSGNALHVIGTANISADEEGVTVFVDQAHPGGGAIEASNQAGGIAVEGTVVPTEEELEFDDQKAGYGVRGIAISTEGGYGEGPGVGVHGQAGEGIGVLGVCGPGGIGVEARSDVEDGGSDALALLVKGLPAFSTAGGGEAQPGQAATLVENAFVTELSQISVTLNGDPGKAQLGWVERHPGSGFTLHFTKALASKGAPVPFSYLIVEPAG